MTRATSVVLDTLGRAAAIADDPYFADLVSRESHLHGGTSIAAGVVKDLLVTGGQELVFVSDDMVDVLLAAAPSLPDEAFSMAQVPWSKAFCAFDRSPFVLGEFRVRAIQWIRISDTCMLQTAWMSFPGLKRLWPEWMSIVGGRDTSVDMENADENDPDMRLARIMRCLSLMLGQKIAVAQRAHPDRASQRRIVRQLGREIPQITEITLRRPTAEESEGEHRDMEWSHRWIVGGHWRNQYLPSTGDHRPTWIAPYVKGPDDKPLVLKDKVYAWRR